MRTRKPVGSSGPGDRVVAELARYFERNGYVRRQNTARLLQEGYMRYKKGDEVRLTAETGEELAQIRRLLQLAGFKPGKPFAKDWQYRQPVYGRGAVRRFLALVRAQRTVRPEGAAKGSRRVRPRRKRRSASTGSRR